MKTINKKRINAVILLLVLIIIFSTVTYAKPFTDAFRGGLVQINDFFTGEQYKPYAKAIDFFFFSLLFIAIYMMGARYAFKEVKRPEQVIVILLGLMTAFLMVLGGFSATALLPYLHWFLYTLLFILYWWLLKGIKNKFWRFVLALLLTLLTIGLIQGLFDALTAPDAEGFFKSLGRSIAAIKFPELPGAPGVPPALRDLFGAPSAPTAPSLTTLPPITTPTAEAPRKGGIFGTGASWWWVLLPLLLALALGGGIFAHRKGWLGGGPRAPPEERASEEIPVVEETIDDLIREITEYINKKIAVLKKIRTIIKEKEKRRQTVQGFIDLYHKKIYDDAFYLDPQHEAHQKLMSEHAEVTEILKIERELEKDLLELMGIEDDLIGRSALPLGNWEREKFSGRLIEITSIKTQKEWYGKVFIWYWYIKNLQKHIENEYTARLVKDKEIAPELTVPRGIPDFYGKIFAKLDESFKGLKNGDGLLAKIKRQIVRYYVWTKEEEEIERKIKLYSDVKELEKWLKKGWATRWHDIKDKQGARLVKVFKDERNMFMGTKQEPGLFKNLLQQLILLQHLRGLLNALKSERVSMMQLQELKIDKRVNEQWIDVTPEAKRQPGIMLNVPHSVHTRIQEGIGPFRVACYVDKQRRGEIKPVEKKHDEVRWTFDEIGITASGTYVITFRCISIAERVYERRDMKSIRVYVSGVVPPAPPAGTPTTAPVPPEHPHVYTPPTPKIVAPQQPPPEALITFFNDLFTALRNERLEEVDRLRHFAINSRIWNRAQAIFFTAFYSPIKINNYELATDTLSEQNFKQSFEPFKPNVNVVEELRRIVEELRAKHRIIKPPTSTPHQPLPPTTPNLEEIGFSILREIAPQGRRHPLARLLALQSWLRQNYQRVNAIPIIDLSNNLWGLIVLTIDEKNGIAVPAIDTVIGPGEIYKWFEGGRYDGTQALIEANIRKLAKAEYREVFKGEYRWICTEKGGLIDL